MVKRVFGKDETGGSIPPEGSNMIRVKGKLTREVRKRITEVWFYPDNYNDPAWRAYAARKGQPYIIAQMPFPWRWKWPYQPLPLHPVVR